MYFNQYDIKPKQTHRSMKKFYLLILIFFFASLNYAQNNFSTKEELDKQFNEIKDPNSNEDIKKIELLINASEKINYTEGIAQGKIGLLHIANNRADYKKMLVLIREIEELELKDNEKISTLHIYKFYANKALGIEKEEFQNLKDALRYAKLIEKPDRRHLRVSVAYNMFAKYYDYKSPDSLVYYLQKQLNELELISDADARVKFEKYNAIALNSINIGNFYLGVLQPPRIDLAEPFYLKVYDYKTTKPDIFEINDLPILCGTGRFFMEKGEYEKSIELANEVLQREKIKKNPSYRLYAYQLIAECYANMGKSAEQAEYTLLYAQLNDSLSNAAKNEVSKEFNRLVSEKENEHISKLQIILLAAGGIILAIILVVWLYWKRKNRIIHQKYEELITKISLETEDTTKETEPQENIEVNTIKSSVSITDETTKSLLLKIQKFENSDKYLKNTVSLTSLANSIGTNTKYLSEVIKQHKGKSFNNYINGLRIDYIVKQLYTNPKFREYKISHLAELSGFSSREVFAIVFKKETGITPSFFISNLKDEEAN